MIFFSVNVAVLVVASVLITSGIVMGNLAFRAGLGVKRWTMIGLILGPVGYPLFNTHKRFAMKRAVGSRASTIRL
ncbi:hypothetical protein EKG38_22090 [Shewanella canadensis]|uniref:Uncharacterized protein n=1 Tax=Shewanella canadensis TaxID=271096 RepID=A0A431WMK7_9GAMM|nr:hypothetical protein [Shewanella canadensis]RTR36820.1 hypothetical protein EKG38_22090 [Shewanella canadensis]